MWLLFKGTVFISYEELGSITKNKKFASKVYRVCRMLFIFGTFVFKGIEAASWYRDLDGNECFFPFFIV